VVGCVLLAHVAGLLGCPQLLDDGFDTVRSAPDGGLGGMTLTGRGGTAGSAGSDTGGSAGSAGSSGSAGTGGTQGGASGTGGAGGAADTAGTGGSAGAGGTAGSAGTGGTSAGTGGSSAGTGGTGGTSGGTPECWTFNLTTPNADHESNCVGVEGYNQIEVDQANSSVSLDYENGEVCFDGTIAATGWGAVYSHVFRNLGAANDSLVWDATAYGVTGFELTTSGDDLPPSFTVTYAVNVDNSSLRDYCQSIGTGAALVPFAGATRDNCGNGTGALTDTTELEALRLSFPVTGAAYEVEFCLRIRAF
jgi:hypothetical protein